jgi:HlyD family secretion protein
MRVRRRTVLLAAAATAVAGATALALRPARVPAEAGRVERGPLEVTVEGSGQTRVRERYEVLSPVSGQLRRIELHPGDRVPAGAVVARVAPAVPTPLDARTRTELVARLEATRAAEAQAKAALERARIAASEVTRERERVAQLASGGAASERDVEVAVYAARAAAEEARAAESAVARAAREVQAAQAALLGASESGAGRTVSVLAPAGGQVLRVLRESGGPVAAGAPLLEIGDPRRTEVAVDLLSTDAVRVRPGARARVTGWGGSEELLATVRRVEPSAFTKVSPLGVEEQRVYVVLDPAEGTSGWQALGDGYAVEVTIVVEDRADAVKVPSSALFRDGGEWAVFVVEAGVARHRRVLLDARAGREAAVGSGLEPGETVVLHPSDRIEDGTRIAIE